MNSAMSTSAVVEKRRARGLEERYEMLRKTLAHYLLLQVGTFVAAFGFDAVGPAMNTLTDKKAELKVLEVNRNGGVGGSEQAVKRLSQNLVDSMGETFNSDYLVEAGNSSRTVKLSRCGCIESVVEQAETYGLTKAQARSIFCGTCMSSYKKAAQTLSLSFKGRLSKEGCSMGFSTN
ncbi:MAG: hypothetical protein AUJ07_09395 [Crenarchaeota archaeon 13_1_40CM_3_53_5]|nr:MAG: hypothetical protein AUJ07_09395 [Crenarchaeota archaeon 13_1_40CM_3_53_5]